MSGFTQRLANQIASGDPVSVRRALDELVDQSSDTLLRASVTIDDAGIRSLTGIYPALVPATETLNFTDPASVIPVPISGYVVTKLVNGIASGYTGLDEDADLKVVIGSDWDVAVMQAAPSPGRTFREMLAGTAAHPQHFVIPLTTSVSAGEWPIFNPDWIDNGLFVVLTNSDDVVGGDPGNELVVVIYYELVQLSGNV